jgi:hypothetical protein
MAPAVVLSSPGNSREEAFATFNIGEIGSEVNSFFAEFVNRAISVVWLARLVHVR